MEPYFLTTESSDIVDKKKFWKDWKNRIPNFNMMEVDASNHMVLLSETESYKIICEFCKKLYS